MRVYTGLYMKNNNVAGVLIGLVFMLTVALTAGYVTRAGDTVGSATASTTAEIQNATSTIDATIRISENAYGTNDVTASILPNVGTTRSLHVTGRISDANGETDIATTSLVFYRTGATNGSACGSDNNDCYRVATCDLNVAAGNDTEVDYDCPISLAYWIDATDTSGRFPTDDWTVLVTTVDIPGAVATATRSIEIESLLALNIPESIPYGTFSLGDETTSGTNQEMVLTQKGNTYADVELSGSNMGCSITGSIPVGNQKWSLLDVGYAAATGTLSGTPTAAERNITYRDSEVTELAASLYWNIGIPTSGVKGLCSGTNTVAVVAATSTGGGGGGLGQTWILRSAVAMSTWRAVAYGNGLFVAVACGTAANSGCDTGAGPRIMTSPDGVTWTTRTSPSNRYYYGLTYGNGLFVAVASECPAYSGCVITSPDGITWTARDAATVNGWQDVAYGNGTYVAVAWNGVHVPNQQVMTSPDGVTWTGQATPLSAPWHSIAYGNGLFVAVSESTSGSNRVMTSPDGVTWTLRTTPAGGHFWNDVVYSADDNQFVAVSAASFGTDVMTSPDGVTWTLRTTPAGQWTSVTYGNGVYAAVASMGSNNIMTSTDGVTWTALTGPAPDHFWGSVAYGNGMFTAVAYGDPFGSSINRVMTSQ